MHMPPGPRPEPPFMNLPIVSGIVIPPKDYLLSGYKVLPKRGATVRLVGWSHEPDIRGSNPCPAITLYGNVIHSAMSGNSLSDVGKFTQRCASMYNIVK